MHAEEYHKRPDASEGGRRQNSAHLARPPFGNGRDVEVGGQPAVLDYSHLLTVARQTMKEVRISISRFESSAMDFTLADNASTKFLKCEFYQ